MVQGLRGSLALSSSLAPGFSLHADQAESEKGGLVGFVRAAEGRDMQGAREKGVRGRRGQEGPQGGAGLQTGTTGEASGAWAGPPWGFF